MKSTKMICKKIFIIFMALSLVLSMPFMKANAKTTDLSRDKQAEILNKLDILRGIGTSFELDKKLTRAEAAAFIVRLLGKEDLVTSQKDQYSYTSYSDVSPDEWYAAYVGYCDKNSIISGYADKTFKPMEYLSEKAFLKMLLTSVGYGYNVDFTWNNVNYYAHKVGIVDDTAYTKTIDDVITNYNRGDVIEVIFSTLKVINKENNLRMVQAFIDKELMSKEEAISYGLVEDLVNTEIQTVYSPNEITIEVSFNEPVIKMDLENIQIYEKNNKTIVLNPIEITKSTKLNTYKIKLENPQKIDEDYTIELLDVIDDSGNRSDLISYDFIGYRPDELVSDFFMISKVEPVNSNVINVYFTHPVNENALIPNYYALKDIEQTLVAGTTTSMQISKIPNAKNGVSIYFKNYLLKADTYYKLAIDGKTTSQYGVNLKDGLGDTVKFKAIIAQNEPFELIEIKPLNVNTIQLSFNKMLNVTIAEQIFSYYLETEVTKTPIKITKATVDQTAGTKVNLSLETNMIQSQKYNLMINNINDLSKQYYITETPYSFTYSYVIPTQIKITNAYSTAANTITLIVDKQLDEESAKTTNNYYIRCISDNIYLGNPASVYYDKINNPLAVKLYLPQGRQLVNNKRYEVILSAGIKDISGNIQFANQSYLFYHNSATTVVDTYIKDAVIVGANTIKLTFNKEIAYDIKNIDSSNYSLLYTDEFGITSKKVPISTIYIDEKTVVLKFDAIDNNKSYFITFKQLIDFMNVVTNNNLGKYKTTVVLGK